MRARVKCATLLALATPGPLTAQADDTTAIASATDLSIPSSPAFVLLDVNPARVVRPGFPQDFKLDLLVNEEGLRPDLALEARPVWTFFFRNVNHEAYGRTHWALRLLSTLSVSLGTSERDDVQRLAWAAKLSLFRKDPLLDEDYTARIGDVLDVSDEQLALGQARIDSLDVARTAADSVRIEVRFERRRQAIEDSLTRRVLAVVDSMKAEEWNADGLDVAIGQLYEYEAAGFDNLDVRADGPGWWASGALGIGDHTLLTGVAKWVRLGEDTDQFYGANVRVGTDRLTFFAEYVFERPEADVETHTLSYGGEVRIRDAQAIEFGIRTRYTGEIELSGLRPIVKLKWNLTSLDLDALLGRT